MIRPKKNKIKREVPINTKTRNMPKIKMLIRYQ